MAHIQAPTMALHHPLHNGEPQPGTTGGGPRAPGKTLKQAGLLSLGHARAAVLHHHAPLGLAAGGVGLALHSHIHRAALGLSEETDAVIIVVSEETQEISVVRQGTITPYHDEQGLREALTAVCIQRRQTSHWQTLLKNLRSDHARKA